MFQPGELDQLIHIQRVTQVDDGTGGTQKSVQTIATGLWAKVRPLSGNEAARFGGVVSTTLATFIIRYRDDIQSDDELEWNGKSFNIRYIPPVSTRVMYLAIQAEQIENR